MKNRLLIVFISILSLIAAPAAFGQELHCNRAIKKCDDACRKESKVKKKMFHDRMHKAVRKYAKSDKKQCKAEGKEFRHSLDPNHVDYYW